MTPVFLDTVGLLAIWDEADQWHTAAEPVFLALLSAKEPLATTSLVLLECGNAASRRSYRSKVYDLRQTLIAQKLLIVPTDDEIQRAWDEYRVGPIG